MDLSTQLVIIFLGSIIVLIYYYVRDRLAYFFKRGIPYVKPATPLGNTWRTFLLKNNIYESMSFIYHNALKSNHLIGFFHGLLPMIMVTDLDLAEQVFVRDFSHFYDRAISIDAELNPLDGHLVYLKGAKWRTIRNKLSPSFTSGKLKGMLPLMDSCVEDFLKVLEPDKSQEMRGIFGRLTLHVTGSCAFGIESDVLNNEDSEFLFYCKKMSDPGVVLFLKLIITYVISGVSVKTWPDSMNAFFLGLVEQGFNLRRNKNYVRNDFLQLLWELKEKGEVMRDKYDDDDEDVDDAQLLIGDKDNDEAKIVFSDAVLTAQAFVFLVGGYETTSTTLGFLSYCLSKNKAAQERAREEVMTIKKKHGSFTHNALKELVYMEACIKETLRLYPPIGALARECTKPTYLGGYHIEKGIPVVIPIMAIQRDPEYFPEPDTFRPERFLEMEPRPFTYLPFGTGPRICLGQRFAMMEMKLTMAKLLCQFSIQSSKEMASLEPIKLEPVSLISVPKHGIHCVLKKI